MSDYIDVKIDIFEHQDQRARVLESLTPAGLIQEILKEFDDITADAPEKYALYLKGMDRPLNPAYSMTKLDIQPQDTLVFDYIRQPIRKMLEPEDYATLREETTGKVFDIQWQPAVIGRPNSDVGHNIVLAANVQLLPNGMSVSRMHAQITFAEGRYFIEPMAEHNPLFLNGKEIPFNSRRELKNNDRIGVGRTKLSMVFEKQRSSAFTAPEPKSQVARNAPPPQTPAPLAQPVTSLPEANSTLLSTGENPIAFVTLERCSTPENVGRKLTIIEYPYLLGRTLPILNNEGEISRKHAEITYNPQNRKFFITDLKSTNGVVVDGVPIQPEVPTEIKPGSILGLGMVLVLRFGV